MSEPKTDDEPKMILVNKLDPMSEYIPFGKYLLSLKQLSKGRFMLRTKSRNPILSFKTIVLTRRTKAIVQKLLQDIDVTFEEVDALNDDERNVINQIVEKSEINTRLKVPNTKKTQLEKDLHKFNVLRGSIISGGDNVEMLKDFRRLLLHLTNENYISKRECNEVLMEMLKLNI
jgi:hypothetical protein